MVKLSLRAVLLEGVNPEESDFEKGSSFLVEYVDFPGGGGVT